MGREMNRAPMHPKCVQAANPYLKTMGNTIACDEVAAGWRVIGEDREPLQRHMLIVTEVAEMSEAIRNGNGPSEHIPDYTSEEEEAADIFIRLLGYCDERNIRLAEAVRDKLAFNRTRGRMHGGKTV